MSAVTICSDFGAPENKICHCFHCFPIICHDLSFWMLSFKPAFSVSSFTFIKRLFSSSSLSAIRVVSSEYLLLLLLLLLLRHFSRVRLCATPSLGFSRQERWSGLPFPSPMHESEKWKWSCSVVFDSFWPHGLQPTGLLRPWDFPGKSTGVGCHCLLRGKPYRKSKRNQFLSRPCS